MSSPPFAAAGCHPAPPAAGLLQVLPLLADHRAISCWLVGSEHAQKLENTVVGRRTGSPLASRRAVAVGVSLAALAVPAAVVAGSSASAADAGGGVLSVVGVA